MGSHK